MKILIAYDGSTYSEAALDDLGRAGLPQQGEALILTVAEVWLPPPNQDELEGRDETDDFIEHIVGKHREKGERSLAEAEVMAQAARDRVRVILPGWTTGAKSTYGSPAWEVLSAADTFGPDLIIVGSRGESAFSQAIFGSIAQKVLTEAECSVRVARGRDAAASPVRLVIGFDGSAGALAAVNVVSARNWPQHSEVRLVTATDQRLPVLSADAENNWIVKYTDDAVRMLTQAGLMVETRVTDGNPNDILVEEAQEYGADCIFVGANAAGSRIERFLLGSTAAAVAARAHCSVEAIRERAEKRAE